MAQVPTGTLAFVGSALGSALSVTAATNASECQLTSAAHGLSNGDFVLTSLGWGRINQRVYRVKSVATNTFVLEGANTSSTTFYPNGTTTGSVYKITTFTQVTLVTGISSSGGEPKDTEYKYVESDVSYKINDGFTATSYQLTLDADAIGSSGYSALQTLTEVQTVTALKLVTRSGSVLLQPGTVALNESVSFQDGQINTVTCSFNGTGRVVRYAS